MALPSPLKRRASRFQPLAQQNAPENTQFKKKMVKKFDYKRKLRNLLTNKWFGRTMGLINVIHVIYIAVETHFRRQGEPRQEYFRGTWVRLVLYNSLFSSAYFCEIFLMLLCYGYRYFSRKENWFIFAMAILSWAGDLLGWAAYFSFSDTPRDIIQVLGILRILRVIHQFGDSQAIAVLVKGLLYSLVSLSWIVVFLFILIYAFALLGTMAFPGVVTPIVDETNTHRWGSLGSSMFTLFLMLTFDGWSDVAMDVQEEHPISPIYFVLYISIAGILLLSIVTSVLVDAYINASRALHTEEIYRLELAREKQAADAIAELITDTITPSFIKRTSEAGELLDTVGFDPDKTFLHTRPPATVQEGDEEEEEVEDASPRSYTAKSALSRSKAISGRRVSTSSLRAKFHRKSSIGTPTKLDRPRGDGGRKSGLRMHLGGHTADEIAELLAPGLDAAGISRGEALEAIVWMKRFGVQDATVTDVAEACSWVGGDSSGRQLLVAKVENRSHIISMQTKINELELSAQQTHNLIDKLSSMFNWQQLSEEDRTKLLETLAEDL